MHNLNIAACNNLLTHYIIWRSLAAIVILLIVNIVFWGLKHFKKLDVIGVWIVANILGVLLLLAFVIPPALDIINCSYLEVDGVTSIEISKSEWRYKDVFRGNILIVTDADGETYSFYDFLMQDVNALVEAENPGTLVYAKHSNLALVYISDSGQLVY